MKDPGPVKSSSAPVARAAKKAVNQAKAAKAAIEARQRKTEKNKRVLNGASELIQGLGKYSNAEAQEIISVLAHQYGLTTAPIRSMAVSVGAVTAQPKGFGESVAAGSPAHRKPSKTVSKSQPKAVAWKSDSTVISIENERDQVVQKLKNTPVTDDKTLRVFREELTKLNMRWREAPDNARASTKD